MAVNNNILYSNSSGNVGVCLGNNDPVCRMSLGVNLGEYTGYGITYTGSPTEVKAGILVCADTGQVNIGGLNSSGTWHTTIRSNNFPVATFNDNVNTPNLFCRRDFDPTGASPVTCYCKVAEFYGRDVALSSGKVDCGYRVGIVTETYFDEAAFAGTLRQSFGVWARVGTYGTLPTGTICCAMSVYVDTLKGSNSTINHLYGIYQKGADGTKNYFQHPIGIGTDQPTEELDIQGSGGQTLRVLRTDANTAGGITINSGNDSNFIYNTAAKDLFLSADNGGTRTKLHSNGDFSVNTSQLFVDQSTGSVGIGTDSPNYILDSKKDAASITYNLKTNVTAAANNCADIAFQLWSGAGSGANDFGGAGTSRPSVVLRAISEDTAARGAFVVATFSGGATNATLTEKMRVTSGGNVGIGTDSPTNAKAVIKTAGSNGNEIALALNHGDASLAAEQQVALNFGQGNDADIALAQIAGGYDGSSFDGNLVFKTNDGTAGNLTERMRIHPDGAVSIGSAINNLNSTYGILNLSNGNGVGNSALYIEDSAGIGYSLGVVDGSQAFSISEGPNLNSQKRFEIDTNGGTIIGGADIRTLYNDGGFHTLLYMEGTPRNSGGNNYEWPGISILANNANSGGAAIDLGHAKGTTLGNNTAIVDNDSLGALSFAGADGTAIQRGAVIHAEAHGDWSGTNRGTDIVFQTTANGSTAYPSDKMRITSTGNIGIGTSSPDSALHLSLGGTTDQGDIAFTIGNDSVTARQGRILKNTSSPYNMYYTASMNNAAGSCILFENKVGSTTVAIDRAGAVAITPDCMCDANPLGTLCLDITGSTNPQNGGIVMNSKSQTHIRFLGCGNLCWQWRHWLQETEDKFSVYSWKRSCDMFSIQGSNTYFGNFGHITSGAPLYIANGLDPYFINTGGNKCLNFYWYAVPGCSCFAQTHLMARYDSSFTNVCCVTPNLTLYNGVETEGTSSTLFFAGKEAGGGNSVGLAYISGRKEGSGAGSWGCGSLQFLVNCDSAQCWVMCMTHCAGVCVIKCLVAPIIQMANSNCVLCLATGGSNGPYFQGSADCTISYWGVDGAWKAQINSTGGFCAANCVVSPVLCATINCGITCVISPIVCGTTCVKSPIVCGSTCVTTPMIEGTNIRATNWVCSSNTCMGSNWFRNVITNSGLYNVANANHFTSNSACEWTICSAPNAVQLKLVGCKNAVGCLTTGYLYGEADTCRFGLLNCGHSWSVMVCPTRNVYVPCTICANITCGITCAISPIVCGTSCLKGVITCGVTCMISPIFCGTSCVKGVITCGVNCVISGTICATSTMQVGGNDVLTTASSVGANFCAGTDINNRVVTANGASGSLCGEANMTFDGSTLNVTGAITASGDITSTSDERVKCKIAAICGAMQIVNNLCGRVFIKDSREQVGVIAQEVEKVLPQVVFEHSNNDLKSVSYGNIVAVLIEAIKDQNKRIVELENIIQDNS